MGSSVRHVSAEKHEPHYGVTTQLTSFNPVWSNLHHYAFVWRTFRAARGARDKLMVLFGKTGWRPSYLGGPLTPGAVDPDHQAYEPSVRHPVKIYAVVQFIAIVAMSLQFTQLAVSGYGGPWFAVAGAGFVVLGFSNVAGMFDGRRWVAGAEVGRLAVMMAVGAALALGGEGPAPWGWFMVGLGAVSLPMWPLAYRSNHGVDGSLPTGSASTDGANAQTTFGS